MPPVPADVPGLQYRRARYYDPLVGQFTQLDPIGMCGGLNLYGYANGDPVNFRDPSGLSAEGLCEGMEGQPVEDCLNVIGIGLDDANALFCDDPFTCWYYWALERIEGLWIGASFSGEVAAPRGAALGFTAWIDVISLDLLITADMSTIPIGLEAGASQSWVVNWGNPVGRGSQGCISISLGGTCFGSSGVSLSTLDFDAQNVGLGVPVFPFSTSLRRGGSVEIARLPRRAWLTLMIAHVSQTWKRILGR